MYIYIYIYKNPFLELNHGVEWSGVELSGLLVAMIIPKRAGRPGQQIVDFAS